MGKQRTRTFAVVGTLGALALVVIAGSAIAAGLQTKSKTVTVAAGDFETATAKCKKHHFVISGGFQAEHSDDVSIFPHTARSQGARKYTATASNTGIESGDWTAYAYCQPGQRLDKRESSVTLPGAPLFSAGEGTATAKCKKGDKVLSGGFEGEAELGGPNIQPFESRKQGGRKWTVSAGNFSPSPGTLTAYAFCADEGRLKTKSDSTTIPSQEPGTGSTKCAKGRRVVSGGFDNPNFGPEFFEDPQLTPYTSKRAGGRTWTVSGFAFGVGGDSILTVYAYCEKN